MNMSCKHCLGISRNDNGEAVAFCEIYDEGRNISLGDCFGNCECQESYELMDRQKCLKVEILRSPTDADWARAYTLALGTEGKARDKVPSFAWRKKLLAAGHSPARTLMFTIRMTDLPYWVSVHLSRHKIGIEHYVQSQRNDRQSLYDRNAARQDAPVMHTIEVNAQALINISHARLCGKAAQETRDVWRQICNAVLNASPEFEGLLVPNCVYHGGRCDEIKPCSANGVLAAESSRNLSTKIV